MKAHNTFQKTESFQLFEKYQDSINSLHLQDDVVHFHVFGIFVSDE